MSHAQTTIPNIRAVPVRPSAEIQEAKRLEKLQSHSSSHRTSGTHRPPQKAAQPQPERG